MNLSEMSNEELEKLINDNGFTVDKEDTYWDLSQFTPLGEDWHEPIEMKQDWTPQDFVRELESKIESWDDEEEAEVYINMRGQFGVPNSIKDLLEDAKWKGEQLADLLKALNNIEKKEETTIKIKNNNMKEIPLKNEEPETVNLYAYGKMYYSFDKDEWNEMDEDEKQSTIIDVADQASEEEGFTVETDEVEILTENKKDPEEGFEINEELAKQCNNIHYKGIFTTYIPDTNTLLFTKEKPEDKDYNDDDDLETIVYRNQTPEEIKEYIKLNILPDLTECKKQEAKPDLYAKIKNEPRTENYEKGLVLKDEIINAWKNNDIKLAYTKWCELFDLFNSGYDDAGNRTEDFSEEQSIRDMIELHMITDTIEDQCVYDVTDYGKGEVNRHKKYSEVKKLIKEDESEDTEEEEEEEEEEEFSYGDTISLFAKAYREIPETGVEEWGKDNEAHFYIPIKPFLSDLETYEEEIPEYFYNNKRYDDPSDGIRDYLDEVVAPEIYKEDFNNTYNWSSCLSHDLEYTTLDTNKGFYVIVMVHLSGDVRGNYSTAFLLHFDSEAEFYDAMLEAQVDNTNTVELDGVTYVIEPQVFSERCNIFAEDGSLELDDVTCTDLDELRELIKENTDEEEKEIKTEVKENSDDVYPKYEFTKEDADYIQKLVGDTLNIIFRDDTFQGVSYGGKIDIELRPTKYIDSGIVNLNDEFYKDVEEYVQKQYPNAELQLNNTGSTIWLRPKKDEKPSRPTSKIENKLEEAFSDELPEWLRGRLNKNVLTHFKSRYSNERVPVMNLAWDKIKYVPSEIPQSARATELKDNSKLPVFKLKIPSRFGNNEPSTEVYVPGLLDPEIHGDLVNSRSYYVPVSKVSYKQLLPYIDEFGYLDLTDVGTYDLRQARADAKNGAVERDRKMGQHAIRDYLGDGKYSDEIKWVTGKGYDKSGYPLDPDKQLRKLAQMSLKNEEVAANRIETIYKQIEDMRMRIANVLTNKNINDLTGNSEADNWDTKMYRIQQAIGYLGDAVKGYTNILKTVDKAKESDENWIDSWLAREFKSEIVNIKDDLNLCTKYLKEFESSK